MRYAVLGSAGQIGAPLCKFLHEQGEEVIEVDLVRNESLDDLRVLPTEDSPYHWTNRLDQADFVFFLAFDVGGSRYLNKYQHTPEFLSNNTKIMDNVFSYLQRKGTPFIFASSQMSNMIHSPYGIAKALGEAYAKSLNGITVKFWNVYGPELDNTKSHVITDFILKARDQNEIVMMTTGNEERQFLFAEDCARCLYELSRKEKELPRDKPYHITSFEWVTVKDVAKMILKEFSLTEYALSSMDCSDAVQKGIRNEPDPYIVKYWRPTTTLENGIRSMVKFYTTGEGKHVVLDK